MRAVRSLCRIFNFEDNYFIRDVAQVEEMMKALDDNEANVPEFKAEPGKKVKSTKLVKDANGGWIRVEDQAEAMSVHASCDCCCVGHCKFSLMVVNFASKAATNPGQMEFPNIFESYLYDEEDCNVPIKSSLMTAKDELYDVITSLETDLNLD